MRRQIRIFAGSSEAGGAECLHPVILRLRQNHYHVYVIAGDNANHVFQNRGFSPDKKANHTECAQLTREVIDQFKPDAILSGILGSKDNIDYSLIRLAHERQIPVLSILDSWMNYGDRVFDPVTGKRNGLLPTRIAVMDAFALKEMTAEGIPPEACVITGHPKFDTLQAVLDRRQNSVEKKSVLSRFDLSSDQPIIVFYSQPLSKYYPSKYFGYDEQDAIDLLFTAFERIHKAVSATLIFKEHPRYPSLSGTVKAPQHNFIYETAADSDDLLVIADVIVSMSSTMLVFAAALGIPIINLQPNLRRDRDPNIMTRSGYCNPVTSLEVLCQEFHRLLFAADSSSLSQVPSWLNADGKVSERIENLLNNLIGERDLL